MRAVLSGMLFISACEPPLQEVSPVDHAVTRWQPIAAADGRLAFALEPRFVHRIEHGVFVEGWQTTIVGPTIVIGPDGAQLATLGTGVMTTVDLPSRLWLFQQDVTMWDQQLPHDPPPRTAFVQVTTFDRAALATSGPIALVPPIEEPIAVGDDLLDGPHTGASDIARDIVIRRRFIDGTAEVLHAGRGFAAVTCARGGDTLVLAYQLESPSTDVQVVALHRDATGFASDAWTLAAMRIDPDQLACDATSAHVALGSLAPDGTRHVAVLDTTTHGIVIDATGVQPPLALREDGGAVAAVRPATDEDSADDIVMLAAGDPAPVPTGLTSASSPRPAVVVGDLALFETLDRQTLDLQTGMPGPVLDGSSLSQRATITAWPDGEAFVTLLETLHFDTQPDVLDSLHVITRTGSTELPLPPVLGDPNLTRVHDDLVYVSAHEGDDYHVFGYDLASASLLFDAALPLCDEKLVLAKAGCR